MAKVSHPCLSNFVSKQLTLIDLCLILSILVTPNENRNSFNSATFSSAFCHFASASKLYIKSSHTTFL